MWIWVSFTLYTLGALLFMEASRLLPKSQRAKIPNFHIQELSACIIWPLFALTLFIVLMKVNWYDKKNKQ